MYVLLFLRLNLQSDRKRSASVSCLIVTLLTVYKLYGYLLFSQFIWAIKAAAPFRPPALMFLLTYI